MLNVVFALVATVAALIGTGLLVSRTYNQRLPYMVAWSLTLFGLCVALGAMTIGFLAGFGPTLLRAIELGGALIAPVWLVLGVVELIAYHVQVRFAAWLFAVSYSIVASVIVLFDPIEGKFSKSLPKPDDYYAWLPLTLISLAHMVVVIALVACALVTAMRATRKADPEAYAVLVPVALVTLAGVLVVSGTRGLLPGVLAVLALGGAAGLIWFGAVRTFPANEEVDDVENEMYTGYAEEQPRHSGRRADRADRMDRVERPVMAAPTMAPAEPMNMPHGAPTGMGYRTAEAMPPQPPPPLYGQITVYTLLDGREAAFDRLAADAVRAARDAEPDTLMYICHEVVNSPTQRIFYQLFRDHTAFQEHQHLPQVKRFAAESRTHVLATNVVELKLNGAKVLPLPSLTTPDHL
ncbi:putative quinol monooxygenase [Actinomadura sp. HBU206391]|uniref:putative quinol monooxygenase n=1 Tax=Actinomadura sp. HBU206391 TaxID=2731692 RepID=UPI00164FE39A|nr:antibiotic biosynthesis monooxygenase [Actinomadura sp. HBU206391]MBC6457670.1 hypothetical protein [Actinomadura sp. HBU206391]